MYTPYYFETERASIGPANVVALALVVYTLKCVPLIV